MNPSQQQAVATVLDPSFHRGFFAVQGPPGCGKKACLVSMVLGLQQNILVVAPSHAAVADIALKLFETN
jgi:superfamily II DNA or RNA helicase